MRIATLGVLTYLTSRGLAGVSLGNDQDEQQDASAAAPQLTITQANLTSKWFEGSDHVQIIEVLVSNTDNSVVLTRDDNLQLTVSSPSLEFVSGGTIKRLFPGQSAVVQLGVKNKAGVAPGSTCDATITAAWGKGQQSGKSLKITGKCGFGDYTASTKSISWHSAPDWFTDAKFGIFIHWGIYSAPAYGSTGANESYAEWYFYRMHAKNHKSGTYQYHLETYGKDFNYDDFIANFTASKFDPKSWLDLIEASGARYFVPTTKHHDGFALFDVPSTASNRTSVKYGPKRDFIKELLDTAKKHYPTIRRGTYFSMPEWYHPDFGKYALRSFKGGPPVNPYTNKVIPYTGYVPVKDFVTDVQYPQMKTLAFQYDTEIMWCDISGTPNNSTLLLSAWFNWAQSQGRQVTFNNRCGMKGDFDTPEYKTNPDTVVHKWESTRGMDPLSFGYNYQTADSDYLTGGDIIKALVDIVSKNGNFLLDIGPRNDGTIPEIMQKGLKDAGKWLKSHAESIYGTRYWETTPGREELRYTTSSDAFFIHVLSAPKSTLLIPDPIPFLQGDSITVLGGKMDGSKVGATRNSNGTVTLKITDDIIAGDKYVWTFKLAY